MKKHLFIFILLLASSIESFSQTYCDNGTGSNFYTKQAAYYCHQYVKAALIGGYVNMATGVPTNESQFASLYPSAQIATDPDFIRVCSISDAKAVVPLQSGSNTYHSAIILSDCLFASTPSSSTQFIYKSPNSKIFTNVCPADVEYYAPIPAIAISGTSATNQGMQFTLTLTNNGQPFLLLFS